jgi:translation initiation factor 2B subunit (eIF-2B alpha/beta/delta family)
MNEVDALRAHIRHLNYAVATTTCRKTVDVLRQMLRETEAKLCAIEPRPPAGTGRTRPRHKHSIV